MSTNNRKIEPIIQIDPLKDNQWDEFVTSHPNGWLCHLSGWKRLIEASFSHIHGYYLVKYDPILQKICAGLPLYFIKSYLTGKRLVCAPFATLMDPLYFNDDDIKALLNAAIKLFNQHHASFVEIRSFKSNGMANDQRFRKHCVYRHHFLELDEKPELLKKRFHRTCIRQRINRALNSNIRLKIGDSQQDFHNFYSLYVLTRKRTHLPPMPRRFFQNLWHIFPDNITLLLAEYKNAIIAGLVLFNYKDRVSAEFAASDESYKQISPNHFLFWHAINLAYQQGYSVFDFGRTSITNSSLLDFKRHWGTTIVDLPHYIYANHQEDYLQSSEDKLGYKLAKKTSEFIPMRAYPMFGEFCYRHLG